MDRSQVKEIVDREIKPLMRRLGIGHWHVTLKYDLREDDGDGLATNGRCTRLVDYNRAVISLDPEEFDDEDEVLRVLRHELFHIVLAPMDIWDNVVGPLVRKDEMVRDMVESVRIHAIEKAVINLERMYHGLTHAPDGSGDGGAA